MNIKFQFGILILFSILLSSFSSCKTKSGINRPDFDKGEIYYTEEWKLSQDSFHFLTPKVEAYSNNGLGFAAADSAFRTRLIRGIVREQKSNFPDVTYHKLDVMKGSYRSLNKYLKSRTRYKLANPNKIVEVPDLFIVEDKKYGVFFEVTWGCCGKRSDLLVSMFVINNEDRTLEKVIRKIDEEFYYMGEGILEGYLRDMLEKVIE